MVLSLNYGDLSGAAANANKLAGEINQYCDDLSRKVQQKMYSVQGGMSSALSNADYYVKQKIFQLRQKSDNAGNLSNKITNLLNTAKRVDAAVKSTIESNQKNFFKEHADLRPSNVQLALTSFFCDMKNVPIIGSIIRGGEYVAGAIDTLKKDLKYWYKCEGGKEFVGIILAAAEAIAAVVVLVCAVVFTGGSVLVFIAGVISAVIGVIDAITNLATSFQALEYAADGRAGRAKISSEIDTAADYLRATNFRNFSWVGDNYRAWNRGSNVAAITIEVTDAVCSLISLGSSLKEGYDKIKKYNLKQAFWATCANRNERGQITGKGNLWNGVKAIAAKYKFDLKEFVLGDLSVKNFLKPGKSKFDTLNSVKKWMNNVHTFVTDVEKIRSGKLNVVTFVAKRVGIGMGSGFSLKPGGRGKTKFMECLEFGKTAIDKVGISKLLTDLDKSRTLTQLFQTKDGAIQNEISDIYTSINSWKPPAISLDKNTKANPSKVENLNSDYLKPPPIKIPNISVDAFPKVPRTNIPRLDTLMDFGSGYFIIPPVRFEALSENLHSYFPAAPVTPQPAGVRHGE